MMGMIKNEMLAVAIRVLFPRNRSFEEKLWIYCFEEIDVRVQSTLHRSSINLKKIRLAFLAGHIAHVPASR